jgi:hypothetical protein
MPNRDALGRFTSGTNAGPGRKRNAKHTPPDNETTRLRILWEMLQYGNEQTLARLELLLWQAHQHGAKVDVKAAIQELATTTTRIVTNTHNLLATELARQHPNSPSERDASPADYRHRPG